MLSQPVCVVGFPDCFPFRLQCCLLYTISNLNITAYETVIWLLFCMSVRIILPVCLSVIQSMDGMVGELVDRSVGQSDGQLDSTVLWPLK